MARIQSSDEQPADTGNGLRMEGKYMFKPRGFYTSNGYVGFLPDGSRIIFATYAEYMEYISETAAA